MKRSQQMSWILTLILTVVASSLSLVPQSQADVPQPLVTPFSQRVYDKIQESLQFFRDDYAEGGLGAWSEATGLTLIAFLDQPQGPERYSPMQGFSGMSIEDRVLVIAGIRYCIENMSGFISGRANPYRTGPCLAAMSRYLSSGGPNNVLAPLTVRQALTNGVNSAYVERDRRHV